jgi:nucleoside-diphosphate-sugar epimerase
MPVLNQDKVRELSCRAWTCDLKALQARTGFVPNYDLERGLKLTIAWYREHKWLR